MFVSRCSRTQETSAEPLLRAAMQLCSRRGLGDFFPVESLTKMTLHDGSKRCREWREVWGEGGRAIFCSIATEEAAAVGPPPT